MCKCSRSSSRPATKFRPSGGQWWNASSILYVPTEELSDVKSGGRRCRYGRFGETRTLLLMPGIEPRFLGHPGRRIASTFEVFTALLLGLLAPEDEVATILRNIANYLPVDNLRRLETSVITALFSSFCFYCTGPIVQMLRYFVSVVISRAPRL